MKGGREPQAGRADNMPLVTSHEVLRKAKRGKYAVGAFNANNMECVKAVIEACEELKAPVILQISQGAIKYAGLEMATAMVKAAAAEAKIPVVLHLDHGTSFEQNVQCLQVGFTSLMFDGSKLPYEENVETTKKVCEIAHAVGIGVEAELGIIPKIEDGYSKKEIEAMFTDPDQAAEFAKATGCDSLAVAAGAVHGMKSRGAGLDFDRITEIAKKTKLPLVQHGSSGVPLKTLQKAITCGICKINVATRVSMALLAGTKRAWDQDPEAKDFRPIFKEGMSEVRKVVSEYVHKLGCAGKG